MLRIIAPTFTAHYCDGETFRPTRLENVFYEGSVLIFQGCTYSAIAEDWWKQYYRRGGGEFDVPVASVSKDGPYAQNRFLREMNLLFRLFTDVNGTAIDTYGLTMGRDGMADVETARRAIFVLDENRIVTARWFADDWISPPPIEDLEAAISEL